MSDEPNWKPVWVCPFCGNDIEETHTSFGHEGPTPRTFRCKTRCRPGLMLLLDGEWTGATRPVLAHDSKWRLHPA